TTDASGNASFSLTVPAGDLVGQVLSATATDSGDNTSEFSKDIPIQSETSLSVGSSLSPSTYGQSVTFTATVAATGSGAGNPTGTVTFDDGSTTLGTGTLSTSNGVTTATYTTAALSVGAGQEITAVYSGDPNFAASTSAALSQTVNQAATTTTVKSSTDPSVYGQSVTFTATVAPTSPGAGNPTGTATFKDGSTTLGSGTLSTSNGVTTATFTTASLSDGAGQEITAVYSGDPNFTTSTSPPLSQTVNPSTPVLTSITVTPASPSAAKGLTEQFTATGTYTDGSTANLTNQVAWASATTSVATISNTAGSQGLASALATGTTAITAALSGITSPSDTLTVTAAALTSIAVAPVNPSVSEGLTEQFTATGTYTDGSTANLTTQVTWASATPSVATISSIGLAQSLATGTTNITAALGGVTSPTDTLTVTAPSPTVYSVTGIGDSPSDSHTATSGDLRYCVGLADANTSNPAGSLIQFSPTVFNVPQTITLAGSGLVLSNTADQTAIAGPSTGVTVSGGGTSSDFSVFTVESGATASMSGLTIANGNTLFSGNNGFGGGVDNYGTVTLTNVALTGNSAFIGGGIQNYGTATLANVTLSGNAANTGGGIENDGTATLTNVTLSGNSATDGGAIDNRGGAVLTVADATLTGNSASYLGNAGFGGGVFNWQNGTVSLTNVTLSGNSTLGEGGGFASEGAATLTNVTLSGNSASLGGGGIADIFGSTLVLNNCIVGNSTSGGNILGSVSGHNNLIDDASSAGGFTNGVNGNIVGLEPLLAPLGNYGGPTETMPPLPGSPAIGAGSAALIPSGITTDQRGEPRTVNGAVDIGAVESQGYTLTPATGSTPQTAFIGAAFPNPLAVGVTPNYASDPVNGGVITFTAPTSGASATLSAASATITNGAASVNATANATAGSYVVSASAVGVSTPASFHLTNTPSLPSWLATGSAATWNAGTKTLTVTGAATITADPGSDAPNVVASGAAAVLTIQPTTVGFVNLGGITLTGGASIIVPSVGAARTHTYHNVIVLDSNGTTVPTFSIDPSSKLDLQDNDMIIQNGGSELSTIQGLAQTGADYPNNDWTGKGLTSSVAASNDANQGYEQTLLAVALNGSLPSGPFTSLQAGSGTLALGPNDIIVKYTYNGDFNLDGMVDDSDAGLLSAYYAPGVPYGAPGTAFEYGDTNGDGYVDDSDAGLFGVLYGLGTGGDNGNQL
ncbi:MAG: beta strand repeat-containing protein, partial [Isosphaeraceae bacterium]